MTNARPWRDTHLLPGALLAVLLDPLPVLPGESLEPRVVTHRLDVGGHARQQRLGLGEEVRVEVLGHIAQAVPLGAVEPHHGGTHARAPDERATRAS